MGNQSKHEPEFEDGMPSVEDVLDDLREIVRDAESLLQSADTDVGDRVAVVRSRIQEKLDDARERLGEEGPARAARMKTAARSTEAYVRHNPWTALILAAGLGYLIGNVGRRR